MAKIKQERFLAPVDTVSIGDRVIIAGCHGPGKPLEFVTETPPVCPALLYGF
jgi:hypothetical protein